MLIIAGHVVVDPEERDGYVAARQDLAGRARATPGCLDLAISADALDPARVNNFERWESQEALDAWREVAAPPDGLPEIRDDQVLRFDVAGVRSPFE